MSQFSTLKAIVQKSVPNTSVDYPVKKSGFFILEIILNDKKDSIVNVDFYKKNKSIHDKMIENVLKKIREKWKPLSCDIKRFIVPLFIYFQDESEKLNDFPIDLPVNKKTYNELGEATYIFEPITIFVWGIMK